MVAFKKFPAMFYKTKTGNEPVREWLLAMPEEDRRLLGHAIGTMEFGWPIGMPLCRPLGDGLWEIRVSLTGNRIARVIFCALAGTMVLLHAFIKKTQKTPLPDLELAKRRAKDILSQKGIGK